MGTRCLPLDVLLDILSRLPVKSLKRFQCVCKSWHHHLRTLGFVTQHLNFHSKNKNNWFLVSHVPAPPSPKEPWRNYLTLVHTNETTDEFISFHWLNLSSYFKPEDSEDVDIRGPCNGIYCIVQYIREKDRPSCISYKFRIALVNLASREFKALPDHPLISDRRDTPQTIQFCFDPKTNDYKVAIFFTNRYHREEKRSNIIQALVYSLNCNSWKKVTDTLPVDFLIQRCHYENNTYVDGNVHLLACNSIYEKSYFIISFNVIDQVFRKINLPGLLGSNLFEMDCNIGAYGGSLSIMVYPQSLSWPGRDYKFVDIWVMQAYGNDEYWTKQTIGPIQEHVYIASWRNGQFLLKMSYLIRLYDSSTQKIKKLFHSPYLRIL